MYDHSHRYIRATLYVLFAEKIPDAKLISQSYCAVCRNLPAGMLHPSRESIKLGQGMIKVQTH